MSKSDGPKVVVALYSFKGKNNDEVITYSFLGLAALDMNFHDYRLQSYYLVLGVYVCDSSVSFVSNCI